MNEMKIFQVSRNFKHTGVDLHKGDPEALVMMVDVDRCIACGSCRIACLQEHGGNAPLPMALEKCANDPPAGSSSTRVFVMPTACRHCASPCEYHNEYNFWTSCPAGRFPGKGPETCDACIERIEAGYMPACATRCTMKCIYIGRAGDIAFALGEKRLREMGDAEINL